MKWLFLLLVAVNVAIFLWGQQQNAMPPRVGLSPTEPDVASIELLSGEDLAELKRKAEPSVAEAPPAPAVEGQDPAEPITSPVAEEPVIDALGQVAVNLEPPEPSAVVAEDEVDHSSFPIDPLSEDEETMTASPEGIVESDQEAALTDSSGTEEEGVSEPESVSPEISAPVLNCWTIGPIADRADAERAQDALAKYGISSDIREAPDREITGYWVLLPPYDKVQSAIDAVARLKALGVVDVQRFYKGEFVRGVSLGVYNRRFNAEKRRAQIASKGFEPEVLPRYKQVTSYWIDYQSEADDLAEDALAEELTPLEPQTRPCED